MKKKAYVSSTSKDLNEYRLAVNKTIKQMGYEDVAMEYYSAEGRPPLLRCQEDVEDCDIYVCIVAWHYGSMPEGENKSFTEMEYDHARKHYKKMFIFLQNEKSLWPPYLMDGIAKNEDSLGDSLKKDDGLKNNNIPGETYHPDDRDRIIKFRKKLTDENLVDFFSTQDNLCQKLVIGLESLERIMRPANTSQLTEPLTSIECVGRDELIEKLKRYYKDTKTAVVSCIGKPGLGKSHVVRGFLKSFNKDDISPKDSFSLKAQWIFGWSFLNQGTDHDQAGPPTIIMENSSTEFFANVLKFYGFEDFPYSEEQQAELLVDLIKTEESLLILDGLDPLLEERDPEELLIKIQNKGKKLDNLLENLKKNDKEQLHEKKHSIKGLIQELKGLIDKVSDDKSVVKDRAMKVFLQKLCDETKKAEYHHKGLVIITTRKAFSDLDAFLENNIYREIHLKSLDNEDGAKLLNIIITEEEQNKDVFVSRVEIKTHFKDLIREKRRKFPNISEEDKIFQILSNEANGNPLGLTLLGKLFVQCSKIKTNNASPWKKNVDSLEKYKDIFNSERKNLALSILEKHYSNWKASSDDQIIARIRFLQILSLLSRPMQEEEFNFLFEITKGNSNKIKEKREQIEGTFEISYNDNKLIEFINPITTFQQKDKEITESQGFLDMEDDLQNLGLIVKRNAFKWDTHSLVRSFFTDKFSNENAEGWRSAHAILLIYFAPKKTDRRPETQVELLPVSRAIHHGCLSENYQAAYQFYENFVIRRYDGFITENLGLVAWDLSILSRFSFLNDLSDEKLKGLTITQEQLCDLLSRKAYCIELQGEFEKAIDLRQTTINRYDTIINELKSDTKTSCEFKVRYVKALKDQAHAYEKLTWLLARTDSLDKAETEAKKGVARALNAVTEARDEIKEDCHFTKEEINKEYEKVGLTIREVEEQTYQSYATLGAIYHRLGQLGNAKINFENAEKLYQNAEIGDNDKDFEQVPKSRYLHSEPGCRYCFFLIDSLHDKTIAIAERPSVHDINVRINYMKAWNRAEEKKHKYKRNYKEGEQIGFHQRPPTLLIQAAHQLAIGGFYLAKNQSEDNEIEESYNVEMAEKAFNEAIQLTQKAHNKSFQCQPLLARAMLRRYSKRYSLALRDLEKVIELAGKMKLYQVDAELLKGNVLLDQALSLFKNKSEEKPFYRDDHELSKSYYLIEKAECCLENVKKNIKDLNYTLRYTNQELLKLRIDIAKLKIKCIEGIDNETIEKEIQLFEDKLEHIGNQKNNNPIPEHDYKSVEIEIEKFRT